ncbi:MAG: hypothetical protein OXN92_13720 [Gammaproteobacteria bacterium]|nr:hypothetical protein [Gammaproteobacteria bacterium]
MPAPSHRAALVTLLTCAALVACGEALGPPVEPPVEPPAPPTPTTIQTLSGGGQRTVQGLSLADAIVVRVLDAQGRAMSGQAVTFTPAAGQGSADPASATTGSDGTAATHWTLGPDPGQHTITIDAENATTTVTAVALDLEAELDTLFMAPTDTEINAVRADWAARDFSAADPRVELAERLDLAGSEVDLRIVSHSVAGVRHYGAILVPDGAAEGSLPILAYLHGGDGGVSIGDIQVAAFALGELRDSFVYVIPSFRAEPLVHGDSVWVSEGPPSPWDYDVDDVLALVNVAIETAPEAKADSINVFGGSRGAGVALLAGVRDPRIARIVAFFGPTYFFDDWVREIVREAALRMPRELTGVAHLDSTFIQPHIRGEYSRGNMRLELVRRSSTLFARDLPAVQVHHGSIDQTVSVSQAEALIAAMEALGRGAPDFEAYIYEGAGHDVFDLRAAIPRAVAFLARALGAGASEVVPEDLVHLREHDK